VLYAATEVYGLSLLPSEVGASMAPMGPSLLLMPLVYPVIERRIGAIGAFRLGIITFLLIFTSMPALGSLRQGATRGAPRNQTRAVHTRCDLQLGSQRNTVEARLAIDGGCEGGPRREANASRLGDGAASKVGDGDDAASESLFWVGLTCVSLARGLGGTMAFTATSVLLNELLTADVGYYNGLANSLTSLARAIAPTVTGVVFAASLRFSAPFPFDHHLAFYLLILVGLLPLTLSLRFQRQGRPSP